MTSQNSCAIIQYKIYTRSFDMSLQSNLESVLNTVNYFINIDAHRQHYTDHFSNLQNIVFKNLKENDVFCYMFNGFQLEGSYGDNVKVSIPNEFDMVFHIKFPEQPLINVIQDDEIPGNVFLDFTKVIQKIAKEKQHEANLKHLKMWLDEKNFLKMEKLQLFIQSCFVKVLSVMQNQITFAKQTCSLRYMRKGPAHTIFVCGSLDFKYSVDFVPGILLNNKQSIIQNLEGQWEAIPKPSQINHHNNTSFRASYYRQEQNIIKDRYQLKNVYRMVKKFRDTKTNMNKLKSYYIKTLFLYKASREDSKYWTNPLTKIIIDIFKDLEKSLQEGNLPFFWNQNLNLYACYSPRLVCEMLRCVKTTRTTLENAAILLTIPLQNRVYRIFLNANERDFLDKCSLKNGEGKEIMSLSPKLNTNELKIIQTKDADIRTEISSEKQKNDSNFRCILC